MKPIALAGILAAATLAACSGPPSSDGTATPAKGDAAAALPRDGGTTAKDGDGALSDPPGVADATDAAAVESSYLGRWTGVEGMYLVVARRPGGGVTLEMQWDLDNKGRFDGSVTAEGLRFMRDGVAESAVHTSGDATGLSGLSGKADCLTVKPGEGYCRD